MYVGREQGVIMAIELRANFGVQVQARATDDKSQYLDGYAAVFNQRTKIWYFEEQIAPGAFARAISEAQDVRSLFNHDPNYPLGRTKYSTLVLREDSKGLWTETRISKNNTKAADVYDHVQRGDVDGMSFAFTVRKQEWIFQPEGSDEMDLRIITEIGTMYDVGPVTYPAYEQTSVKVRDAAKAMHTEARGRWESRRVSIQVPAGFDFVCREARGQGPDEDAQWETQQDDFREKQKREAIEPDEETKEPVKTDPAPEPTGEGAPAPEAPSEAPQPVADEAAGGDEPAREPDATETPDESVVVANAETIEREIAIKRTLSKQSAATRKYFARIGH